MPSQEELAAAERARAICQKCKSHHQTWERCSPNRKKNKNMGNNTLVIANLSDDQYAKIAAALGFEAPDVEAAEAPASETGKAGKKDKKSKGKQAEAPEAETFTKKGLEKKERDELVSICEALGIEHKSKRVPTLVTLILDKQTAVENAAEDGDDDDFEADDDGWEEDVPPADEVKPEKAKKGKGDKKKGKKKK